MQTDLKSVLALAATGWLQ